MATKIIMSVATANGDTTKTLIDTITIPQGAKRIVGVISYNNAGAGNTTLENLAGILELESNDDINLQPCQIPIEQISLTGTGMGTYKPMPYPVDIPCGNGGQKIKGYVTLDLAQTIGCKSRFGLVLEV